MNEPQESPLMEAFVQRQFREFDRQLDLEMNL